jgi:hypothetical protein
MYNTIADSPKDSKVKGNKVSFDSWQVHEALRCLVEAEKIRANPDLMAAVKKVAATKLEEQKLGAKTMAKLAD